jgi:Domain of unknown function (DUF4429)/Short C-terminal domain/Protein of unknown function (DUF2510)
VSTSTHDTPGPGWYADPKGVYAERFWDGERWTDRVQGERQKDGQQQPDQPPPQPIAAEAVERPTASPDSGAIQVKGHNGQITIEGDWLTIERKGLGRIGHSKGDRRIPLASITAVQMRPAGAFANGFLKFTVPGSPELRGGLNAAGKDENAVIFRKSQQDDFNLVRERVEAYIAQKHAPQPAAPPAQPDVTDQLKKLAELRDAGVLTTEEFESKKAELLARL